MPTRGRKYPTVAVAIILLLVTVVAETAVSPFASSAIRPAYWGVAASSLTSSVGPLDEENDIGVTAELSSCISGTDDEACLEVRGGLVSSAESVVERFLFSLASVGKFHVQGWRWHTLSLVRDSRRLEKLALSLLSDRAQSEKEDDGDPACPLEKASQFVVDFNMNGLHRVEEELFFPWLREKLCTEGGEVGEAFREVIKGIDEERVHIGRLGQAVKEQAKLASTSTVSLQKRSEATSNVAQMSAALSSRTQELMEREEKLLVPAIAALVPEREQKSFNSWVIIKLGIFDSRVHLVGMHDAVWEGGDISERDKFQDAIPYIPRMMIPRWRRLLYEPRAGMLDLGV